MKKIAWGIVLFSSLLWAENLNSVNKGLTYYKYILKPLLGYDGLTFTKQYTQKEWESLFDNQAQGFIDEFAQHSTQTEVFLRSDKFKKISNDLKSFAQYYAKDAKASPSCE